MMQKRQSATKFGRKLRISACKKAIGGVSSSRAEDDTHQGGNPTPPISLQHGCAPPPFTGRGVKPHPLQLPAAHVAQADGLIL